MQLKNFLNIPLSAFVIGWTVVKMQPRNFLNFLLSLLILGTFLAFVPFACYVFVAFSACLVGINLAEWLMTVTRKYFMYKKVSPKNKAVLITGCDSGFGNMLAKRLDKLGYRVFAACLDATCEGAELLSRNSSENLTVLHMDVTSDKSIQVAKELLEEKLGNNILWAVVNNAGIGVAGEIDWTSVEEFQKVYDVNTMGMLRVTKSYLPFLKKSRGRIVNITSISGRFTCPGFIPYCMSKSAAIALTTGLRIELAKWGVKAISIEPWFYRTDLTKTDTACQMAEKTWKQVPNELREEYGEDYKDNFKLNTKILLDERCSLKVYEVVDCLEDAITAEDPLNTYFPSSRLDKILIKLALSLPNVILESCQRFHLERFVKPAALMCKTN